MKLIHATWSMRLENWFLLSMKKDEGVVIPKDFVSKEVCLIGEVYGKTTLPDGSCAQTSPVINFSSSKATTQSGSIYELGKMHPDYEKLINAFEKGLPIIKDWRVGKGLFFGEIMGTKNIHGLRDQIYGKLSIKDKENNIYIIYTNKGPKEVFVDWISINCFFRLDIQLIWSEDSLDAFIPFAYKYYRLDLDNPLHKKLFE